MVNEAAPGHVLGIAAENNVGSSSSHIGRNRDHALAATLSHNLGLALNILGLCIEQLVLQTCRRSRLIKVEVFRRANTNRQSAPLSKKLIACFGALWAWLVGSIEFLIGRTGLMNTVRQRPYLLPGACLPAPRTALRLSSRPALVGPAYSCA